MKLCQVSCCLSLVFFVSMIYFSYFKMNYKDKGFKKFELSLLPNQRQIYEAIKKERSEIYTTGYILGLILSLFVIAYYRSNKCISKVSVLCIIFSVSFVVNYFYYMLSPKTTYMVEHLETNEQKTLWVEVYTTMQYNYHVGFVFGILALVLLGNGVCV